MPKHNYKYLAVDFQFNDVLADLADIVRLFQVVNDLIIMTPIESGVVSLTEIKTIFL